MRVEPFTTGDYIHVYNRGNRKMPIVYDENDRWRFLKILRYLNDDYSTSNPMRSIENLIQSEECRRFQWPKSWPKHKPLVRILSYCLMPNHYHLLLQEIMAGGVSRFMKKLGDSYTSYINIKYNEVGRVFQGSYKGRTVKDERDLQYLDTYIQVFNSFELYPGGISRAMEEFDEALEFAVENPFSSLGESLGRRNLYIVDRGVIKEMLPNNLRDYKEFVYDALMVRNIREILGKLTIENVNKSKAEIIAKRAVEV